MSFPFGTVLRIAVALGFVGATLVLCAEPSESETTKAEAEPRPTVAMARDRAKLMHNVFLATLDSMHRHYFHANRSVLPARAMEDVFEEIEASDTIKSRWIAVNTTAMSVDHEPSTKFEKDAAAAIAAGKEEFEVIDNGIYRRVGAVRLGNGCVSCHTGFSINRPNTQRYAGLVISMPVEVK